jgi:hypothetical protein
MKRFTVFFVLLLAFSVTADYTTNVTVIETVDSLPVETPTLVESVNVTVIEEIIQTDLPAPSNETPLPEEILAETPTETPAESATEIPSPELDEALNTLANNLNDAPAPTEVPTNAPTEVSTIPPTDAPIPEAIETNVPFGPGETEQPTEAPTALLTSIPTESATENPAEAPTFASTETPTPENVTNPVLVDAVILDENGDVVPAVVALLDESGQIIDQAVQTDSEQDALNVEEQVVDAYVAPLEGPVQDILFENVEIKDESSLGLKIDLEVPEGEGPEDVKIARAYAIDPTAMEFDEALVTAVAEGNSLYKCKDWKFEGQRCDGGWVLLRTDLTPGAEYDFVLDAADPAFAEGIRTNLRIYADADANPNVTAVVTDGVGVGVPGILVDFSSSAGVMTPSSGFTGPDGTITSTQSGGSINDIITANATGLTPVRMNTSTATAASAAGESIIWFDNSTQTIKGANVNSVTRVLNSGTVAFTVTPVAGSLLNPATISVGASVSQVASSNISKTQVWHNTYQVGDSIQVDAVSGPATFDFVLTMPAPPEYHLFAYAIAGADPAVTAVVVDENGTGVPNVTVNFSSSAGVMTPSTGVTGVNGTITSVQSGGAVGDTINVTANISGSVLQMKQVVTAAASPVVAASSRVIAWLDNTTNRISVAVVDTTAASRYVLSATGTITATALDRTPSNGVNISVGSFVSQAAPAIGSVQVAPFTYGSGDVVQIAVATTTPANDQAITMTKYNRTFLEVFATSGANPNVTAVVTDENGLPVPGVTVNFSASAGAMSITSGVTNPDGTLVSIQTGGALGNTINVTYADQQQTVTTAVSAAVAASDRTFAWYDRVNRTWHIATVTNNNRVLVSASTVAVAPLDNTPQNDGTAAVSTVVAQAETREALVRVAQGTTANNDSLQATVGTTSYATDAYVVLPDDSDMYLYAFATAAANPNVTVVVTDRYGNGIPGVAVSYSSSAGTLSVTGDVTNASGMANFSQSGGALGDVINVSSAGISKVTVVTSASAGVAAADYVYAWFMPDANRSRAATVTRANNVLASGTTTTFVPIDNTPDNNLSIVVNRTAQQSTVNASASNVTDFDFNDIISISVLTTNAAQDAVLVLNTSTPVSSTTRVTNRTRLLAFASSGLAGGANPNVTAVVIDPYGYGVPNITVDFDSSAGVMTPSSAVTGPDGTATSVQTGGASGNRINVTSFNLSQVNITTSPAIAIAANSTSIAWYDSNQTRLMVAVVSPNNTLVSSTVTPTFTLFDETPMNGVSLSVGTTSPQISARNISITQVWRRTFGAGDMIFVETATTATSPDGIIVLRADERNQLFAYATDGANPNITAVVTDMNGVGVPNITVTFSADGGVVPASGTTGVDGTVTIAQTLGSVGDNITVSTDFQNLTVTTATTPAVAASSRAIVWLDNTTNLVKAATVSTALASRNVLAATGVVTVTNTDNTPLNNVTFSSGSVVSQATPNIGGARIAQGTYGDGDILSVSVATTTPALDGAVKTTLFNMTYVDAFALSGANPVVIAYVHDVYGMPVEGVEVNFSSSAGIMTPSSNFTDHRGIATSSQSGGALGNVINVTYDGYNPVRIVTAVSSAIAAADKVFAIYDPRTRITQVAAVTNSNNVITSTSAVTPTAMDASFDPGALSLSTVLAQSTTSPASFRVAPVTENINDGLSIAVSTTSPTVDAYLTLGSPSGLYLYAFATGGADPNVTAVVTDSNGVGVFGIPITFTASAGALSTTLNTTNTSGMATATQSGGALGDTIVVTSPGLTNITIVTAASAAISAADVVIPWFDPDSVLVRSAVVTRANNVLATSSAQNYLKYDNTPFNNASMANLTTLAQNANSPSQQQLNASSIADGDFVVLTTTTATPALDGIIFVNTSTSLSPNLTVEKNDTPDPVNPGGQIVYTLTFNNTGNGTALDIVINESYPPGVAFNSVSPAGINTSNSTFVLSGVSPNTSTTVNITVDVSFAVPSGTVLNNTVNVTYLNSSGGLFFLNASANTTVLAFPSIITNKTASPNQIINLALFNYTILVNNTGASEAFNVTVVEFYPENVSFVSSVPAPASGNDTFFIGTIAANSSFVINITLSVNSPNGSVLNNTYNVTFSNSSGSNFTITNGTNTTVISIAIINVTKVGTPNPVTNGSDLSYVINITNVGDDIAYNATLNDTYPANVSFFSSSPAPTSGNNSFDLGNLTPGASTTVNITVTVSPAMTSGVLNNTATVFFNLGNGTLSNASVDAFNDVTGPAPPPPPPSGGGGGGGGGTSICPPYCRDPKYQTVSICQSQVCQIAREVLPPPQSAPFSGVKPKPAPDVLTREELRVPGVERVTEFIPVTNEAEITGLKAILSEISGALQSANTKIRVLTWSLVFAVAALVVMGGIVLGKRSKKIEAMLGIFKK